MALKVISEASAIDHEIWEDFVNKHPQGNAFQTPQMHDLYLLAKGAHPVVLAAYSGKTLVGILVAVIQREYEGILGSLTARSIIWGGPLIQSDDPVILETIMKKYENLVGNQAIYTQIRNLFPMEFAMAPLQRMGYSFEDHLDIHVDLGTPVEILWKGLHSTRRKQIERGYRRGAVLSFQRAPEKGLVAECHEMIAALYKRIKLPYPKKDYFAVSTQALEDRIGLFILRYQGKAIGCRFVLIYKQSIYDWYAGSRDDALDKYPNDILPWEVIKWGAENGYKTFQFGGAGKPGIPYGVRDHKLKFGGTLVNFGRFEKVHKPILMNFARVGLKIWQKMS